MAATFLVALTFIVFFTCPVISGTTYADESHCYKHNAYFYAFRKDIGIFCASGFYARVPVWLQLPLHGFHKSRLPCCLWTITLQLHVDLSVYFRNGHNSWILYPEGSIYSSGLCLLECSF